MMDFAVAGEIYIDIVMSGFPEWPKPGEEHFATQFRREVGGGAPITAAGLAKLGRGVTLECTVGREDGGWVIQRLKSLGVDTSAIRFDENEPTAATVAVSSPSDRAFFTYRGANRNPEGPPVAARHTHLAIGLSTHLCDRVGLLQSKGQTVSADIGWNTATSDVLSQLKGVDFFFPNEAEGERITGEREPEAMLHAFARAGFRSVALKLGENGSALLWNGSIYRAPAPKVSPVETTGAGDAFNAGFLHSWMNGGDPVDWLKAGNFCGAMSTRALGGMAGLATAQEFACR